MFSSWNKVNVLASVLSLKQRACSLLQFMGQRSENLQLHAIAVLWWFFLFLRFFSLLVLIMATDSFEILLSSLSCQTEDFFFDECNHWYVYGVCVCAHTHIYAPVWHCISQWQYFLFAKFWTCVCVLRFVKCSPFYYLNCKCKNIFKNIWF